MPSSCLGVLGHGQNWGDGVPAAQRRGPPHGEHGHPQPTTPREPRVSPPGPGPGPLGARLQPLGGPFWGQSSPRTLEPHLPHLWPFPALAGPRVKGHLPQGVPGGPGGGGAAVRPPQACSPPACQSPVRHPSRHLEKRNLLLVTGSRAFLECGCHPTTQNLSLLATWKWGFAEKQKAALYPGGWAPPGRTEATQRPPCPRD